MKRRMLRSRKAQNAKYVKRKWRLKTDNAAGQSGIVTEMVKAIGLDGVLWMTDVCNSIMREWRIPEN